MISFRTLAFTAATILSTAFGASAQSFDAGHIQTLDVASTRGASQMTQAFAPGQVDASLTRVCLQNYGSVVRSFTHAVPGVNPLVAQPNGGQSCANFSAGDRVGFGMLDGGEPAQANRAMVMTLSAFQGGLVTFTWY